jgi:hypothetical protein
MFALLRIALVIGAIFYFSPARKTPEGSLSLEALIGASLEAKQPIHGPGEVTPQRLETVWNALPESARRAVLDQVRSGAAPFPLQVLQAPRTDTLQPEDHRPAWVGGARRPGA